jgi:hypothetical protein
MKSLFNAVLFVLGLIASISAAPAPTVDASVESTYPIGKRGEDNAKAVGRLFEIDGKAQYFAGIY